MTDISTIKNLLHFFPYLKREVWYMFGIGIVVYGIYIIYLIAFERYYKSLHTITSDFSTSEKKTIHDMLDGIPLEDTHFFERVSFIIRTYLEDSNQVALAMKKTPRDIHKESISNTLKEVLDICVYYEYAEEEATPKKKTNIIELLKNTI